MQFTQHGKCKKCLEQLEYDPNLDEISCPICDGNDLISGSFDVEVVKLNPLEQAQAEIKEANSIIDTKLEELITATGLINQLTSALDASNVSCKVFQLSSKFIFNIFYMIRKVFIYNIRIKYFIKGLLCISRKSSI